MDRKSLSSNVNLSSMVIPQSLSVNAAKIGTMI
jgi:hypothetical protein